MNWYIEVLKKYAVFSGRARRKEYWFFFLFNLIVNVILGIFDVALEALINLPQILGTIYSLAVLIPSIAVSVRRLHDIGRSGWWLLLSFIPILGWIVLLVFAVTDSEEGENQYGVNPKTLPEPA